MRLGILTDGESGKSAQLLHFALFLWTQIRNYSARWGLRPASVRGVEVAKASAAAKARGWV